MILKHNQQKNHKYVNSISQTTNCDISGFINGGAAVQKLSASWQFVCHECRLNQMCSVCSMRRENKTRNEQRIS